MLSQKNVMFMVSYHSSPAGVVYKHGLRPTACLSAAAHPYYYYSYDSFFKQFVAESEEFDRYSGSTTLLVEPKHRFAIRRIPMGGTTRTRDIRTTNKIGVEEHTVVQHVTYYGRVLVHKTNHKQQRSIA